MNSSQWDFRDQADLEISQRYESIGYTIEDADTNYIESMREEIENYFHEFTGRSNQNDSKLENAHQLLVIKKAMI